MRVRTAAAPPRPGRSPWWPIALAFTVWAGLATRAAPQVVDPAVFVNEVQLHHGDRTGFFEVGLTLAHDNTPVYSTRSITVELYAGAHRALSYNVQEDLHPGGGTAGVIEMFWVDVPQSLIPSEPFSLATVDSDSTGDQNNLEGID
eukprot:SAG22_NODE_11867_length_466_cov_0.653951_1_plen_145_part_10